jgi:putative flippase GtrA
MSLVASRAASKLVVAYALCALVATIANIGAQDAVVWFWPHAIFPALLVGTGIGLAVKYVLDKHYIFRFRARNAVHDGFTFVLYSLMGVATTVIFWGFELGFQWLFGTREMRYLGGIIGLAIGYVTKYHLDKRYVFRPESA